MYGSRAIFGAPIMYYKSLGTMSAMLRRGNISSRSYGWAITITHDYKHILYLYHINDKLSSHNVACYL
jgi:hypothetical protein